MASLSEDDTSLEITPTHEDIVMRLGQSRPD